MRSFIKNICVLVVFVVIVSCSSCSRDKAFTSFTPELKELLTKQYGVTINDSAVFISAQNYTALERDPYLQVVFTIPKAHIQTVFKSDWWNVSYLTSLGNPGHNEVEITNQEQDEWYNDHTCFAQATITMIDSEICRVDFRGFDVYTPLLTQE